MNKLTKMTLANREKEGGMRGGHEPENRRDSRGRYAPKYEMESRYEESELTRGYAPHNDRGSMRMGHDGGWVVKPIEDNYGPESRRDRMGR